MRDKSDVVILLKVLLFCLIPLLYLGCERPSKIDEPEIGNASALRNNLFWTAECTSVVSSTNPNKLYLYINKKNSFGELRESILIGSIPVIVGKHLIVDGLGAANKSDYSSHYATLAADGDVISGLYHVIESDSCYIDVLKIDTETNDFMGSFQLNYVVDAKMKISYPFLIDTIRFAGGEFVTKIQ